MTQTVESRLNELTAPVSFAHGVPTQFAAEPALIELLDRYPEELMDINRYDFDDKGQVTLTTGSRGRASGEEILKAIRAGQLWVNLRGIEKKHPALWGAIRKSFFKMKPVLGGAKARRMTGQLIISSPVTRVPYHFDAAGVVLFHLRGRKKIWIYPTIDWFLPQEAMEGVITKSTTEELPYHRRYDGAATVFDLKPGDAVTWPLYAPHRVENHGDGICVSLSMDYQTWGSRLTTGAHYANGVLRSWGFKPREMEDTSPEARFFLWAMSLVMKRLGLAKNNIKRFERQFALSMR